MAEKILEVVNLGTRFKTERGVLKAIDGGLSVINCTHYASENLGVKRFADYARRALENKEIYFFCDGRFA